MKCPFFDCFQSFIEFFLLQPCNDNSQPMLTDKMFFDDMKKKKKTLQHATQM